MSKLILVTVDVEEWFQVENLRHCCPVSSWHSYKLRVERNVHIILDLLDEASCQHWEVFDEGSTEVRKRNIGGFEKVHATFFVLGWIAERVPHLIREIHSRGHEVASHGYNHNICTRMSNAELRKDLVDSKRLLEDVLGCQVFGYRAPSFSVSDDILKLISDAEYEYDSSYNSFSMHGRYGKLSLNNEGKTGIAYKISDKFYELPISNWHFGKKVLPWGGGAYFRLIPTPLFKLGVENILREQEGYLFYVHPWEVDPEQPKPEKIAAFSKLRHYTNLEKTEGKLRSFVKAFEKFRFLACHEHVAEVRNRYLTEGAEPVMGYVRSSTVR